MKNFIITNIVLIVLISCGGSTTEAPEVSIQTPQPKASDSTQPKNTIKINTSDEEKVNNQNNIESSQAGNFTLQCVSSTNDPLNTWVKAKGPIGGLGYNVRYRHDNQDTMYFTDDWSGIKKSNEGGLNWIQSNGEGQGNIDFRVGPSLDNIPVYALSLIHISEPTRPY